MKSFAFDAIGTHWIIDIYNPLSEKELERITVLVRQRILAFERIYSRFRNDSLVHKIQHGEIRTFPEESREMIQLYLTLYRLTDGAFTPLVGSLLEDAGYDSTYSFKERNLQAPPELHDVLDVSSESITIKKEALFDFGAAGKGALVDIIGYLLRENNMNGFCIDAGGDLLYFNPEKKPLRVGLEHPDDSGKVIGVAEMMSGSICGSSGNRRKWGKYHHIMNPRTLKPADTVLSSWVIADSAMTADALATAVFFTEPEKLREAFHFSYLILNPDYSIKKSSDFPGELYYTEIG